MTVQWTVRTALTEARRGPRKSPTDPTKQKASPEGLAFLLDQ